MVVSSVKLFLPQIWTESTLNGKHLLLNITGTRLYKHIENFTTKKGNFFNKKF